MENMIGKFCVQRRKLHSDLNQTDDPLRFRLSRVVPLDDSGAVVKRGFEHIEVLVRVHRLDGEGVTN